MITPTSARFMAAFNNIITQAMGVHRLSPKYIIKRGKAGMAELRYNYEEPQTISMNAGKTFSKRNLLSYSITPVAGFVAGKLNGGTVGTNADIDYKNLFFSCESEYTFSFEKRDRNLFFNWSECGYQITKQVYGGMAMQAACYYAIKNTWEPGVMMGYAYKTWTFPMYAFSPFSYKRNFVLGINWQWNYEKL